MNSRVFFTVVLTLGCASLFGCASTAEITREAQEIVATQRETLASTPNCCEQPSEMRFVALAESPTTVEIPTTAARVFPEGRSHFLAFELPERKSPYWLMIESHQILHRRHGMPYIFAPSALAFDERFQESGRWVDLPLCYTQGWSQRETGFFTAVRLDPVEHSKLVIFTTDAALAKSSKYSNSASGGGIGFVTTVSVDYDFPHSPVGRLDIGPMSPDMESYLRKKCPGLFGAPSG